MSPQPYIRGDDPNAEANFNALRRHDAEKLARFFHETYERLAPDFGYRTREASAKPWEEVPEQNRELMIATCRDVLDEWGWD